MKLIKRLIQIYSIIVVLLFALSAYIYLPPVEITDFVVDSKDNIIVLSTFQDRLFYISKSGRISKSKKLAKGTSFLLAIDKNDNLYVLKKKNTVEVVYSDRAIKPKIYTASENLTNQWLLDKKGDAINLNRSVNFESSNITRTRTAVALGGALFFEGKDAGSRFSPFKANGKVFKANPYTADSILVFNSSKKLIKKTSIVPFLLKPFSFIWDYTIISIILVLLLISLLFNRLS